MVQRAAHRRCDDSGEQGRNRVAYLLIPAGLEAGEPEVVREGLNSGSLPYGEGAVLPRVDVPVSVLGNMGGDGAGQSIEGHP